ncbi:anoctamin-4-like isoform X2 [Babylonia areolata]|uniref:anoctamin-4-like isoform X2 n=1 Tax=Babylonia areolata TaxID=304850 RepID=UPI003FD085C5
MNLTHNRVAPGSQPAAPPPPSQGSLYPSAMANTNNGTNGQGTQPDTGVQKGGASTDAGRTGDEMTEEHADDIRLLPGMSQAGDVSESQEDKTLFFKDGQRRIDYMFAYKYDASPDEKKKSRREEFEGNLRKAGMALEQETVQYDDNDSVVYVKVHAPWSVLTAQAEIMNMKMPLQKNDMVESMESCWQKCPTPFDNNADILPVIPDYFTAAFSREREEQFIIENKDTFFSTAQRSLLVYQVLQRCVFDKHEEKGKSKFGIKKMLSNNCYDAAYPLHEGDFTSEHSILTRGKANNRHLLYETWAKPGAWYKFQPLDHIRLYFGEKVGIYFCWLGFYTGQLFPAAIVGLAAFLYGLCTFSDDPSSNDICDEEGMGNTTMCPLCDGRCPYWYLYKSCTYSIVTYLFDNEATVFFAAFMALWATFFIEMWKRKTAEIEYDWDVADFEEEETVRPEFEASVKKRRTNPINMTEEPYLGLASRVVRYLSSLGVVVFMLCIVLAAVFGVIVYRMTVSALLFAVNQEEISQWSSTITSITAACINLLCIIILGKIYLILARVLTDFETHRTQTEWEDSFTLKMFLFQFVNHYSSLFYIAFFKGKFTGRPGDYNRNINGERQEECDPSGCLIELLIQLMIIMVGKQTFNNSKELFIPKIMNWIKSRRVKEEKENKKLAIWENDYNMAEMPDLGLFDEYLEMVIQYGFVTIFVAAFPLAPLFALLNNIIEIRLDAYKFVTQWRRPLAARAQDIGIWFGILRGITTVAVASNAAIIAFTSEFIPKLVYRYGYNDGNIEGYVNFSLSEFYTDDFEKKSVPKTPVINTTHCKYRDFREDHAPYKLNMEYWHVLTARLAFVIVFILVVVFLQWLVSFLITDTPRAVKMQMLREKYLAKESILDAEVLRRNQLGGASSSNLAVNRSPATPARDPKGSLGPGQPLY